MKKIPDRETCFEILRKNNFPQKKMRHIVLVEKVAIYIGKRLSSFAKASEDKEAQGASIDLDLISAGALLHDIDKGIIGAGDVHPKKGVELLEKLGYKEVARICETHTINSFLDEKTRPITWEEKIVALADKMVKNRVMTVDERYKLWWEENLPEEVQETLRKTQPLFKKLEKEIFGMIGEKPEEIKYKLT